MMIAIIIVFIFMNRARGSQFFGLIDSTTEGRLLAAYFMAVAAIVPFIGLGNIEYMLALVCLTWVLLYVWMVPGWDDYWNAAIGTDATHSKLWGIDMMTLRMALLLPYYGLLTWLAGDWHRMAYSATILLMGAVYAFWGVVTPDSSAIRNAELTNGAIMGITTVSILWS